MATLSINAFRNSYWLYKGVMNWVYEKLSITIEKKILQQQIIARPFAVYMHPKIKYRLECLVFNLEYFNIF